MSVFVLNVDKPSGGTAVISVPNNRNWKIMSIGSSSGSGTGPLHISYDYGSSIIASFHRQILPTGNNGIICASIGATITENQDGANVSNLPNIILPSGSQIIIYPDINVNSSWTALLLIED
jgi:hypothetical protein